MVVFEMIRENEGYRPMTKCETLTMDDKFVANNAVHRPEMVWKSRRCELPMYFEIQVSMRDGCFQKDPRK
jgi:hypothetical protein